MRDETFVPTPETIGFENESTATVADNVRRALEALSDYLNDVTLHQAEEFVSQHVPGAGPDVARHVFSETKVSPEGPDTRAALYMGGDSPYAAAPADSHSTSPASIAEPDVARGVSLPTGTIPLYFDYDGTRAVVEQLTSEYGRNFRTAITTKKAEDRLSDIMAEFVHDPKMMHYGEEKSRNDFAGETTGFVNGCIDPGDDYVLDLLAELDLNAEPETVETDEGEKRAHGRGFVGEDAEEAAAILASVRENHTAQAAGRYARKPDDPASTATVFVRTDALPPGYADIEVPGVTWTPTPAQEAVVTILRESREPLSARTIASQVELSKRSVLRFLGKLAKFGIVDAIEGVGAHGATLYSDSGIPHSGVVDLGYREELDPEEIATSHVWDSYTRTVAIRDPAAPDVVVDPNEEPTPTQDNGLGRWRGT